MYSIDMYIYIHVYTIDVLVSPLGLCIIHSTNFLNNGQVAFENWKGQPKALYPGHGVHLLSPTHH